MDAAYVYKEVRDALSYFPDEGPIYNLYASKLRTLLDKCRAEVESNTLSGATKDRFKAALSFAKHCQKKMVDRNPTIAGAWIDEKGRQGITDSYILVLYEKPYDGLPKADVPERSTKTLRVDQIIANDYDAKGILPEVQTLKALVKTARIEFEGPAKRFRHYTFLEMPSGLKICVDTEFLITAIECAGGIDFEYHKNSILLPIKISGDGSTVLLVPIRVANDLDAPNVPSFNYKIN